MRWEGRREGDRTWGDRPEALTLGKDGRPLLCKEFPSDMFHLMKRCYQGTIVAIYAMLRRPGWEVCCEAARSIIFYYFFIRSRQSHKAKRSLSTKMTYLRFSMT